MRLGGKGTGLCWMPRRTHFKWLGITVILLNFMLFLAFVNKKSRREETGEIPYRGGETERALRRTPRSSSSQKGTIIIHAKYRGGSTFCSEFFMRHLSIAYIFEPLISESGGTVSNIREVVGSVLSCRLDANKDYALREVWKKWYHRQAFCIMPHQTPGCIFGPGHIVGRITLNATEGHCKNMRYVAAKVIRLPSFSEVQDLVEAGTKIVHLVRDPRGVMRSRSNFHKFLNYSRESRQYCTEAVNDLMFVRRQYQNENWNFTRNYYLLRFEDLAANPWSEMQNLYRFLDIPPDDNLMSWVKGQEMKSVKKLSVIPKKYDKSKQYTTDRENPYFTAQSWRLDMAWGDVKAAQSQCDTFMDVFGYRKFEHVDDQSNLDKYIALPLDRPGLFV